MRSTKASKCALVFSSITSQTLTVYDVRAQSSPAGGVATRCETLQRTDLSRVLDAATQITGTQYIESRGREGDYCEVTGYVAPSFGFVLRLPSNNWNGKFVEIGCGGACGTPGGFVESCDDPVSRGYACIGFDSGHRSTLHDVKWAYNEPQAPIDYSVRSPHLAALAGKAIVEKYYEQPPHKSYFLGCSAGGLEGMQETQTFPWDFDGVVANSPSFHISAIFLDDAWAFRALTDHNGEPLLKQKDLNTLHKAVVDSCDMNDGLKDGLIGDPRACHFEASTLRCNGTNEGNCLTPEQIHAVEKIYRGPVTTTGEQIVLPASLRGSERNWLTNRFELPPLQDPMSFYSYAQDWFRYTGFQPNPGPMWSLQDLDFDRDHKRLGVTEHVEGATNPDLRRFKAAGGKLLSITGWADEIGGVLDIVDYYETTEKVMGGRAATRDFFRLFVVPGMNHCTGGEGAFFIDYLGYLEAWVERGQAPDKLIGAHLTENSPDSNYLFGRKGPVDPAAVEFTRPIYPYPSLARYRGRGDPRDAASFAPTSFQTDMGR